MRIADQPKTVKSVYRQHNHILRSRVGGAIQSRSAACIFSFNLNFLQNIKNIWVLDWL